MLVGLFSGWFARKVHSTMWGYLGSALGLLFAFGVAAMPPETGEHYYLEIMLPGFVVRIISAPHATHGRCRARQTNRMK
jgi:hypothetical protein